MAHFARLENNKVVQVIVVNNDVILENEIESEEKGIAFCKNLFGEEGIWKQTSYNGTFRKNFASSNYVYDEMRDAFIPPQPFVSWILNEETCQWIPPVPIPGDAQFYGWSEKIRNWVVKPDSGLWVWNFENEVWEEFID